LIFINDIRGQFIRTKEKRTFSVRKEL